MGIGKHRNVSKKLLVYNADKVNPANINIIFQISKKCSALRKIVTEFCLIYTTVYSIRSVKTSMN